jgi:hypothetical protein
MSWTLQNPLLNRAWMLRHQYSTDAKKKRNYRRHSPGCYRKQFGQKPVRLPPARRKEHGPHFISDYSKQTVGRHGSSRPADSHAAVFEVFRFPWCIPGPHWFGVAGVRTCCAFELSFYRAAACCHCLLVPRPVIFQDSTRGQSLALRSSRRFRRCWNRPR